MQRRLSERTLKPETASCHSQNACKGQGFLELTRAQCDAAKAKVKEQKPGM
jgi:hypothetical protein